LLGPGCGPHDTPVAPLEPRLEALLDALADGYQPSEAFALAGLSPTGGLAALAELELWGRVRRGPGGRIQTQ
ncbi:MAG: hypothetical protein ACRDMX_10220, partial [Solirubrobacteraceae bacterium]